jgi:hypothetical protein
MATPRPADRRELLEWPIGSSRPPHETGGNGFYFRRPFSSTNLFTCPVIATSVGSRSIELAP